MEEQLLKGLRGRSRRTPAVTVVAVGQLCKVNREPAAAVVVGKQSSCERVYCRQASRRSCLRELVSLCHTPLSPDCCPYSLTLLQR